jgi:hypothetical protein
VGTGFFCEAVPQFQLLNLLFAQASPGEGEAFPEQTGPEQISLAVSDA